MNYNNNKDIVENNDLNMNNILSFDDVDKIIEIVDKMPGNINYFPTVEELKAHNVEKKFAQYAPFLYWISESMKGTAYVQYKETNRYISSLFQKYVA